MILKKIYPFCILFTCSILLTSFSYADNGHPTSLITITEPSDGSTANVGSSITVTAEPLPNVSIKMINFMASGDNPNSNQNLAWDTVTNPPYSDTIKIPATNFIGNVVITVVAVDDQGNYDTQKRTVQVLTGAGLTLKSISLDDSSGSLNWAKSLNFTDVSNPQNLVVSGVYSDGATRDITLAPETVYNSSDPSVAIVDKNGGVSAVGNGNAQITVTNSGVSVEVTVKVNLGPPEVGSVFPESVQPGASIPMLVITGSNLGGTSKVEFLRDGEPDPHLQVGGINLGPNGANVRMPLRVDADTPAGTVVVVITTPVGTSTGSASRGNLLSISSK